MATNLDDMTCETKCWTGAAAGGIVVLLLLMLLWGWGFVLSLIVGAIVFVGAGFFLRWNYCSDVASPHSSAGSGVAAQPAKGATKPAASTQPQPAAVVPPAPEPEHEPAPERDRTPEVPMTATPEADAAASGPTEPKPDASVEVKPNLLDAPQGTPDDLKRIKGVGPKLEEKLNGLGIYHYSQIAKWSAEEIAWVDSQLNFRGRIARDGWIEQAKTLAAGGETEFSRRADGK